MFFAISSFFAVSFRQADGKDPLCHQRADSKELADGKDPNSSSVGSSSLTRVFCVCKTGLHPLYVNIELITPDHHVVSRHDELSQWCILRENTCTLKFSERSSYNATAELSKIRCIKVKHHMQSKYVT